VFVTSLPLHGDYLLLERIDKHLEFETLPSSRQDIPTDVIDLWQRSPDVVGTVISSQLGLEAHLNAVRLEFSYPKGQRRVGVMYDLGVCQSYRLTAVSPTCPICLDRPKHAPTRYNYRCNLRLSAIGSGWLTLWC
jgi:hypothetical protein